MTDVIDATDDVENRLLNLRIQAAQNYKSDLRPTGKCHWCDEPFVDSPNKLFCDSECALDHERHKQFNRGK